MCSLPSLFLNDQLFPSSHCLNVRTLIYKLKRLHSSKGRVDFNYAKRSEHGSGVFLGEGLAHAKTLWQDGAGIEFKGSDSKRECEMRLERQKEADDRSTCS